MQSINTIGYNLFPRDRMIPEIKPCSLQTVTAQFYVQSETCSISFTNDGSPISIDWNDGSAIEIVDGSISTKTIEHTYTETKKYLSVYIQNCTSLQCNETEQTTTLSTVYIKNLGWGMKAEIVFLNKRNNFTFAGLPFYDFINIAGLSETIDLADYNYCTMLNLSGVFMNTFNFTLQNLLNVYNISVTSNHLDSVTIDSILSCLVSSNNESGAAILQNQSPAASLSNYGVQDKAYLESKDWIISTD